VLEATLCYLVRGEPIQEVLLGLKKAGFGAGRYVGVGGKIEPGEPVVRAAVRELWEETGVQASEADLIPMAHLTFLFPYRPDWDHLVHAFLVPRWQGEPRESDEMEPAWFRVKAIPFDRMWDDSAYWLPHVLSGRRVRAVFVFDEDNEHVATASVELLDGVLGSVRGG